MKAKKLLAALGALVVALPGMALAGTTETSEIVAGHTVFAAVEDETKTEFAAIAGLAAKRTTIGGILWFNDQELVPASVASELAAGRYVIATQAGADSPFDHMDAAYAESYQLKDPNDKVWLVDRYVYDVCSVESNGQLTTVPCEESKNLNNDVQQDFDSDGNADLNSGDPMELDGDGNCDANCEEPVLVVTHSIYVVTIGETAPDAAPGCSGGSGEDYNFVILVRMDKFVDEFGNSAASADGKSHGAGSADTPLQGNSHGAGAADHTHDTAQVDLWFSEQRPAEPPVRTMMFTDAVGGAADCA